MYDYITDQDIISHEFVDFIIGYANNKVDTIVNAVSYLRQQYLEFKDRALDIIRQTGLTDESATLPETQRRDIINKLSCILDRSDLSEIAKNPSGCIERIFNICESGNNFFKNWLLLEKCVLTLLNNLNDNKTVSINSVANIINDTLIMINQREENVPTLQDGVTNYPFLSGDSIIAVWDKFSEKKSIPFFYIDTTAYITINHDCKYPVTGNVISSSKGMNDNTLEDIEKIIPKKIIIEADVSNFIGGLLTISRDGSIPDGMVEKVKKEFTLDIIGLYSKLVRTKCDFLAKSVKVMEGYARDYISHVDIGDIVVDIVGPRSIQFLGTPAMSHFRSYIIEAIQLAMNMVDPNSVTPDKKKILDYIFWQSDNFYRSATRTSGFDVDYNDIQAISRSITEDLVLKETIQSLWGNCNFKQKYNYLGMNTKSINVDFKKYASMIHLNSIMVWLLKQHVNDILESNLVPEKQRRGKNTKRWTMLDNDSIILFTLSAMVQTISNNTVYTEPNVNLFRSNDKDQSYTYSYNNDYYKGSLYSREVTKKFVSFARKLALNKNNENSFSNLKYVPIAIGDINRDRPCTFNSINYVFENNNKSIIEMSKHIDKSTIDNELSKFPFNVNFK